MHSLSLAEIPNRIHVLSDSVIDQIAAGEVVERPSSIVKELVENSLDANSQSIKVELENGGIDRVSVSDNGVGMVPENLRVCVKRHATSKIQDIEDLDSVQSYGFRGEALSSIAAVGEVEIISRHRNTPHASKLRIDYSKIQSEMAPCSAGIGTQICVNHIFRKIPARRKFLRTAGTELSHCTRVFKELALSSPGIHFQLFHNARSLHEYAAKSAQSRIEEVLKPKWDLLPINAEVPGFQLEAHLSSPEASPTKSEFFVYVNGRIVRNRLILAGIRNTYLQFQSSMPSGVVYLHIDPTLVDVNVHPQKLEVKILGQERLYQWIGTCIRKAASQLQKKSGFGKTPPSSARASAKRNLTGQIELTVPPHRSSFRYLGRSRQYLICENEKGLLLMDSRAILRRDKFQRWWVSIEQGKIQKARAPKMELLPITARQMRCFESTHRYWETLGFECEVFDEENLRLYSWPALFSLEWLSATVPPTLNLIDSFLPKGNANLKLEFIATTLLNQGAEFEIGQLGTGEFERLVHAFGSTDSVQAKWMGRPLLHQIEFAVLDRYFDRSER